MTPTASLVFWLSLVVLSLVFLAIAYTLWRGKEYPRMSANVFGRDGESVMGEHLRDYKRRLTVHSIVNRFAGEAQPVNVDLSFIPNEEFPDVSFWQGVIDWAKMATKTRKVIIRAGQNLWVDIKFKVNYAAAKLFGILRGVYFFYDGRVSPGKQAALLVGLIKDDLPELGVWIDWEKNFNGAYEGLKNVVAMMQEVERLLPGVKVGIYTGYWYFRENSNPIWNAAQYTYLALRGLWLAFYAALESVLIPAPWTRMTYWQKGTPPDGKAYGTETEEIDMNEDMAGDPVPPPPPEPEEPMTLYGTVIVSSLNVRSGPGANYQDVGDLLIGDKVEASENVGGWWKLSKVTRGATNMPLPLANCYAFANNGLYIRTDPAPAPTPAPAVPFKIDGYDLTLYAKDEAGNRYKATISQDGLGLEWTEL